MVKRFFMARQKGFEPLTPWFVAKYSIQLSYWRVSCSLALIYYITAVIFCQAFFEKIADFFTEAHAILDI